MMTPDVDSRIGSSNVVQVAPKSAVDKKPKMSLNAEIVRARNVVSSNGAFCVADKCALAHINAPYR